MPYDFDRLIERRGSNSAKWDLYPDDVLPLWVADMDFMAPEALLAELQAKLAHGIFGYEYPHKELKETVARRMKKLHNWQVSADAVVTTPGVISGFNAAARTVCMPGDGILIQPPVYPPFLSVSDNVGLHQQLAPLMQVNSGHTLRYKIDWEVFETAVNSGGAKTRMFLLCQPHNPIGQIYSREELIRMADICLKNDMYICSDEIHSEILLGEAKHIPIASLDPDIADRTITLIAPSKTFNIAGLHCSFAIIQNEELRDQYKKTVERMTLHVSSLSLAATQAAFSGACDDWLAALNQYLTANRDCVIDFIAKELPGIRTTVPDASYLAWLDCTELVKSGKISSSPYKFFLHEAKVALNDGVHFGPGGEGFVRLNFGCPRVTLVDALERMKRALKGK